MKLSAESAVGVAKTRPTEWQVARMERILESTLDLIGARGADQVTMRDIAVASKVAEATLYNRFGTKDSLIALAVIEDFESRVGTPISAQSPSETPVQKIIQGLAAQSNEVLRVRGFSRAMIGLYFKPDGDREMADRLLAAVQATYRPMIDEMKKRRCLRDWVSPTLLLEEMSDRILAVIARWAQNAFADGELTNRLILSVLSTVIAMSRGQQAIEAEGILAALVADSTLG